MLRCSCRFVFRRLGLLGLSVGVACATDTTGPAPLDAAHLYYQLTLNHHAITMALAAPYDTIRLSVIAQSATGVAVVDTGTPIYTVQNGDTNITVSPTGLLTAVAPDVQAQVVASRTIGNVTHVDTTIVNVNDVSPVPIFTGIKFVTEPGDSAKTTIAGDPGGFRSIRVYAMQRDGDSIPHVVFRYSYSPENIIKSFSYNFPYIEPARPGVFPIVAEAAVYGVSRTDTLYYEVGWPFEDLIQVFPNTPVGRATPIGIFGPQFDTVAVGATVTWENTLTNQPIDVVFAGPSNILAVDSVKYVNGSDISPSSNFFVPSQGGGDIAAFTQDSVCIGDSFADQDCQNGNAVYSVRARQFPTPGTYPYHSALYGTTGVIIVLSEFQDLTDKAKAQ